MTEGGARRGRPPRGRLRVFWLLFAAYVGYYFCRMTVPVALPLIERDFGFSNTETGLILSAYFACYSISKFVNGFAGDWLGGKSLMLAGMVGSAFCNIVFGFGTALGFLAAVWGLNAFFQSMGWLGMVPIMSRWYPPTETGRAMGFISISYQLGDFAARLSAAALLVALAWPAVFRIHALVLLGVGLLVWRWLPAAEADAATPGQQPYGAWLAGMLANRWFWVVCAVYALLSILRYTFWGWSVDYLVDSGAGIGTAALTSAVYPLFGSIGTICAGWISDRMGARRGPVMAIMSFGLVGAVVLFSRIPTEQPLLLAAALATVGFLLYGPYSLVAGALAIDFGSTRSSASASGIFDSVGVLATVVTGVGMGYLIDVYGWERAFSIVAAVALLTAVLSLAMWNMRPAAEREP